MQFDIWIPSMNLAVEYQGSQHYKEMNMEVDDGDIANRFNRDMEKRLACETIGIKLVSVPFWWDWHEKTLANMLLEEQSDCI
jgi:hypothetical protein